MLGKVYPYVNYIKWLSGLDRSAGGSYWQEYLGGYERVSGAPYRKGARDGMGEGYESGVESFWITKEKALALRRVCRELGVTENTFLQGAWGYLLSRYNDTQDVVFGCVVSGRPGELEGSAEMIGLFINTIPVRIRYSGETTVRELLKDIQQKAIAGMSHHYDRLTDIQSGHALRNGLFDHILVYENYPVGEMASEGLGGKGLESLRVHGSEAVERPHYDLNMMISPVDGRLEIAIRYNGCVYEGKGIERVVDHLERVIEGFIAGTEKRVTEIGYLSGEERGQLLEAFNDTEAAYPADKTIVELFGEQVERTPDRVAVVDEGEEISYRELDERSNQLGHYLRERGVREETLVPICIDRSVEMIVGILGILKAGGAYVPIDPGYPEERIRYMVEDAGAGSW